MGNPLDEQVGGDHYKKMKIQPITFCEVNRLTPMQSKVIKYTCRHESKDGLKDLRKARHMIDLMIDFYYPGKSFSPEVCSNTSTRKPRPGQPGWDLPEPTVLTMENK